MAIFHLNAQVISRGKGQSAIAAAAYRSGERLRDEQTDEQKFYETRAERIVFTDIMAPKDAPEWAHDRNRLWNEAERAEKRKDAQLAREIEVSLPHELTEKQREWLVKDFAREAFVRRGYAVDIAIHAPDRTSNERNHHCHLMITMRTLGPDGFAAKKDPTMNRREQLGEWREQWANLANRHLERHGHEARIDHRSLKEQGIDREPTVHVGYAGMEIAARGGESERFEAFKAVLARNDIRLDLKAIDRELKGLEKEQAAETAKAEAERRQAAQAAEAAKVAPRQGVAEPSRIEERPEIRAQKEDRPAAAPGPAQPAEKHGRGGLQVLDHATGVASRLGDFVTDLLAGPSAPAPQKADMKAFVADPEARKQQQLARLEATRQTREEAAAIERIAQDLEKGKALNAQDVRKLTPQHQTQIQTFGDDAVRQMVDEARKRSEQYWKGDGRERDR